MSSQMHSNYCIPRSILILSTAKYLVPRIQLEKAALEEVGYNIDLLNTDEISFNIRFLRRLLGYYMQVAKLALRSNYSVVHLTHIVQIPLSVIFKIGGGKVVYDAFERYSVDISEKYFYKYRGYVRKLIEIFEDLLIWLFVDAVLVVSTPNEYLLHRYAKRCPNVGCLYNVPPISFINSGNIETKFRQEPLVIAYVGAVIREKGSDKLIPLLLKFKERQPRFKVYMIGSFIDDHEKNSFIAALGNSGLSENVELFGQMSYEEMNKLLFSCQIGLTLYSKSSRFSLVGKGSSRKNFTYMCAGMAIVSSKVGELSRVIEEERCGIVIADPEDMDGICRVLRKLAEDRESSLEFAKNGVQAIREKYNWDLEKGKLLEVYNRLWEGRRRVSGSQRVDLTSMPVQKEG